MGCSREEVRRKTGVEKKGLGKEKERQRRREENQQER